MLRVAPHPVQLLLERIAQKSNRLLPIRTAGRDLEGPRITIATNERAAARDLLLHSGHEALGATSTYADAPSHVAGIDRARPMRELRLEGCAGSHVVVVESLLCVERGLKLYSNQLKFRVIKFFYPFIVTLHKGVKDRYKKQITITPFYGI